jgi:hypothetical protein
MDQIMGPDNPKENWRSTSVAMIVTVACGGMINSAALEDSRQKHAGDKEKPRLPTRAGDGGGAGNAREQRGKPEAVEPGVEVNVAGDKAEIGQHHVAANDDGREIEQRGQEEHNPGAVLEEVGEILA